MGLEQPTEDNLNFMVEEIGKKLQVVNASAFEPGNFDISHYDEIKEMYDMIESKENISVSEMDAIISELGRIKKT
ncbi:DUF1128 domain-containing protein [Salibacterium qingdaonense]|uniref:Uncharacterized protein YfkK, UPF0435 family n=1 Tax=Salibacterium qingdaonense TaxID=266892 RepID=A0A1I4PFX1_9BACI|nr:DUF1128 domain-containing protein [Salibacterium qingdaonense]SFM26661.1 Uncharacterized protein YfkK, UPF0435 family [Salibacterium qingdaonense]